MTDQASKLRRIAWDTRRKGKYITVSSGKGGVGKTNFSVNMAYLLCKMGKKVLLFDADLGLANVDILLNISPEHNIKDYLENNITVPDLVIKTELGFDVIPSASGFTSLTKLNEEDYEKLTDIFVFIDSQYEYIIFDAGAGIADNVMKFVALSDFNIVITQGEPTAVTDAYALIKVANTSYGIKKIFLVINRVTEEKSALQFFENLQKVITKFLDTKITLLGFLMEDKNLIKSVKQQKPLSALKPDSVYVKNLLKIIDVFSGKKIPDNSRLSIRDFLRRLVS